MHIKKEENQARLVKIVLIDFPEVMEEDVRREYENEMI